jgi:general stress protein 26
MTQTQDLVNLNQLIGDIDFAMLTTIRPDGTLHSCPMAAQKVQADGIIWFLSDANTEKVEAIRTDHRVNLTYTDADSQRYVSITGHCELVRDQGKTKQLWKPVYQTWFPKGVDDPNLVLLKIHMEQVEYWDAGKGRMAKLVDSTQSVNP